MRVVSNREIERIEETERNGAIPVDQTEPDDAEIAGYVKKCFEAAKRAKEQGAETQILSNMQQIDGKYSESKLAAIKEIGGSQVFMMITNAKCKNAFNWVQDILLQPNQRIWGLDPTPLPELPEPVMQEIYATLMTELIMQSQQLLMQQGIQPSMEAIQQTAVELAPKLEENVKAMIVSKAKRMAEDVELKIDDAFKEGGWDDAIVNMIPNIIMHTGFLKGPIPRKRNVVKVRTGEGGLLQREVNEEIIATYESRHPIFIYPSPDSTGIDDGYLIDRIKLTPIALQQLIDVPGYSTEEIRAVLEEARNGKLSEWLPIDREIRNLNDETLLYAYDSDKIDCLEFWGYVDGQKIIDWGLTTGPDGTPIDPVLYYNIVCYLIGNHVIKIGFNKDPLGRKPFYKASFEEREGSFWGKGLPEIIADVQSVCNACARAIVNNIGIACLTGDTVVYRNGQDRKYAPVTLKELFDKKSQHNSGLRRIKLRSLNTDTGEFFGNRIVDVYDNGIADVFEVKTEKGYTIKATGTHRFMNDSGEWQELDDFDIGHSIAVNGDARPLPNICVQCGKPTARCGVRCRSCASKQENSAWNKKQIVLARINSDVNATTARSRYECQSVKKSFCEECGGGEFLEQHHIDRVPWNNKQSNLRTLCVQCHSRIHAREDSLGDAFLHKYITFDTICSITYIGQENVYNLQMSAPYHNFIANGFVSKNSGPQVERNIDRIPAISRSDNHLIPWKVWDVTESTMSTSPALNFYQPPMVVERLMSVYSTFSKIADEHSGVPAFAHGDPNVGGAGNTASGLSMLMGSASRGIKAIISQLDKNIIMPSVERQYALVVEQTESYGMICDYQVVTLGHTKALIKEQLASRRLEFMQMTANPIDMQILGMEGRKYLLEETAKSISLDLTRVFAPPPPTNQPPPEGGAEPPTSSKELDAAGNPVVGTDTRTAGAPPGSVTGPAAPPVQPRAMGGPVDAGQPYLVGEQGPEVVVPETSGVVIPNEVSQTPITDGWGDEVYPSAGKKSIWSRLPLEDRAEDILMLVNKQRSFGPTKDATFTTFYENAGGNPVKAAEDIAGMMESGDLPHMFMWESPNTNLKKHKR